MTDRDAFQLRGPVHTVRFQYASFNLETGDWEAAREGPTLTFDRDGREERVRRKHTIFSTTFDERGLRTTVSKYAPRIRRQRGLEYGLGMSEGQLRDVLTRFDEHDRPIEIVQRDAGEKTIYRTLLSYDDHDRLCREEVRYGESLGGTWSTADSPQPEQPLTPDQIDALKASIIANLKGRVFLIFEYEYDDRGRVARLQNWMPPVSECRRRFVYDARDNVVEEHYENTSRQSELDTLGNEVTSSEVADESWSRYEYRYDDHGNWSEKITFGRVAPDPHFHRSHVERRTITYY